MYREDMRPVIVESFVNEFNKHGPKLNLDDVASAIHMSKKTIYRFFRSKQSIYEYILNDASKQILFAQQSIYSHNDLSTKEKLQQIITIHTEWESKIDLSHMFELKSSEPEVFERVMEAFRVHWDAMYSLLEIGQKDGTIKPEVNIRLVLNLFQQGIVSLYSTNVLEMGKLNYSEAIDSIAAIIFNGVFVN